MEAKIFAAPALICAVYPEHKSSNESGIIFLHLKISARTDYFLVIASAEIALSMILKFSLSLVAAI